MKFHKLAASHIASSLFVALFLLPRAAQAIGSTTEPLEDQQLRLLREAPWTSPVGSDWFVLHFQSTAIVQYHPAFSAPYSGNNSLQPDAEAPISTVSTLFGQLKLWSGAELLLNPEMSGGQGLSNTNGIAAYPNGLIYRVGDPKPTLYIARLALRQTIGLGGGKVHVEAGPNQRAGTVDRNRLTLTLGRTAVPDVFDGNPYAHDPAAQFLSWGLWESGAYDYPADTRGYTIAFLAELTWSWWSLRAGAALGPRYANSLDLEWRFWKSLVYQLEYEARWELRGRPGAARLLAFLDDGRMGDYEQTLANPALYHNDVTATRDYGRIKYGFALSANQEIVPGKLGVFLRASWNDGHTESWIFTEIDHSLALGAVLDGTLWRRRYDELGVALVLSGVSEPHQRYLAAGGHGFIIGDGALHYGPEFLGEVYYKLQLTSPVALLGTYQPVVNPGYNQDRGPVHILSARVNVRF